MQYTVNYYGKFFIDDSEEYNTHWFNSFEAARNFLWDIIQSGIDNLAYLKDEEYHCTFRYDPRDNDFVWEG